MKRIMYLLVLSLLMSCMTSAATAQASTKTNFHLGKSKVTMAVGEKFSVELYNSNEDAVSKKGFSISNDNESIATVNKGGTITAIKTGRTTITFKSKLGDKYTCDVTVVSPNVNIKFDSRGGSTVSSVTVKLNEEVGDKLPAPTKKGYVFKGWYYDVFYDEYSHWLKEDTVLQTDITAYAVWETASKPAPQYIRNETDIDYSNILKEAKADLQDLITDGMTDFDKVKVVHDFLIRNMVFDAEIHTNFWNKTYDLSTQYVVNRAMSQGYASSFWVYMKALGIECKYISNGNHEWNLVKVGGEWYHIDIAWDDFGMSVYYSGDSLGFQNGAYLQYIYFLISTAELEDNDINDRHYFDENKYPECKSTKYNDYNEHNDRYVNAYDKYVFKSGYIR